MLQILSFFLIYQIISVSGQCCKGFEGVIRNGGSFSCPSYVDNMNCTWLLQAAPGGSGLTSSFSRINFHASLVNTLESSDYLKIYDGPGTNFPVLGNFYGQPAHNTEPIRSSGKADINSSLDFFFFFLFFFPHIFGNLLFISFSAGRTLLVQFKSDGSRSGGSFSFRFFADKCLPDVEYNEDNGKKQQKGELKIENE